MKILLAIVAVAILAGSLAADFYWRRWMNRRRDERDRGDRP